MTIKWLDVDETPAPLYQTCLLYQRGTLYPVVGWSWGKGHVPGNRDRVLYSFCEGGPEDGEHLRGYFLAEEATPTHWAELPEIPTTISSRTPCTNRNSTSCHNCGSCECSEAAQALVLAGERVGLACPVHSPFSDHARV